MTVASTSLTVWASCELPHLIISSGLVEDDSRQYLLSEKVLTVVKLEYDEIIFGFNTMTIHNGLIIYARFMTHNATIVTVASLCEQALTEILVLF